MRNNTAYTQSKVTKCVPQGSKLTPLYVLYIYGLLMIL